MELIMRNVLDVIGDDVILIIPPGCAALFSGYGRESNVKVAGFQCNLENVASTAAGVRRALTAKGNEHTTVLGFAGDGATVDIGIQALSGVMERGDRILYICYDNEAYMNTGIQGSGSTPQYAWSTTTPAGKHSRRKDLMGIAMAHDIPYAATASLANLNDLRAKVAKAKATDGPSLLHIHTPCPTGWGYPPAKTIELARAAVKTGCWVNYEYEMGAATIQAPLGPLAPLSTYTALQKRFGQLDDSTQAALQETIQQSYRALCVRLAALGGV